MAAKPSTIAFNAWKAQDPLHNANAVVSPLLMPQLWDDRNIEPLSRIAEAVHRHGCKLAIQLWHAGVRGFPTYKQAVGYDPDQVSGFAFGIGPDRYTMMKYGITDLRLFREDDLRFTSQFN